MDKIKQKILDLPDNPGVYIMKSAKGQILYIGKARSLKNRVRQYFGSPKNKTEKVLIMVSKIDDFDYIITKTEVEALILENNLIKKHKPPYNILLKDDKSYPFIKINLKELYPKVEVVRKLKKDGAKYFGPYMQGITSKDILDLIGYAYQLRSCNLKMDRVPKGHRPCLNFHIGKCLAPCINNISSIEYHAIVSDVIKFLQGNDKLVATILKNKMIKASQEEDFELAINYRNQLTVLEKLVRKQVTALPNDLDMDIFAGATNGINTVVAILIVRGGKLLGGDKEVITDMSLSLDIALGNYIVSYYDKNPITVNEIITSLALQDEAVITQYLSETTKGKINIVTPIQGVRRQLADMADINAKDFLDKCDNISIRKENMSIGGVLQLQEYLDFDFIPMRIECYDISNISGTDKVASMAVFINGESDKSMYRKFKIKTVQGANDFASMKEALLRRFAHFNNQDETSFNNKPDLIVVDGGKGQLSYALEAMAECSVNFPIIGLAERDEEIFIPNKSAPVILPRNSFALTMLQRLRDEAHRFAISFHKQLRAKRQTYSELLEIKGIGEKTVVILFNNFKIFANIKKASFEQLKTVKGVNEKQAKAIYDHFQKEVE